MSLPLKSDKPPKYVFGLLETPATASTSSNERSRPPCSGGGFDQVRNMTSTTPYQSSLSSLSRPPGCRTPATGGSGRSYTPQSRTTPYTSGHGSRTTPGYTSGGNPSDYRSTAVIVALTEGRGNNTGHLGLASIDLKRPTLTLSQFTDNLTYTMLLAKLQLLNPIEVLMPSTTFAGNNLTRLYTIVNNHFQNTTVSTVQRKYFNETNGLQMIKHLCLPDYNSVEMEVRNKPFCLAACAALLKYVEFMQTVIYAPKSLKIILKGIDKTAMIDMSTAINLELLANRRDPDSEVSLFGIMNYTKTAMGARLLRTNVLQPPSNLEVIVSRHEAVGELSMKSSLFFGLQAVIARFLDLEHILSMCAQIPKQETVKTAENRITNVIYLKHHLDLIEPLRESLKDFNNGLFNTYFSALEDPRFQQIQEKIDLVICDSVTINKNVLNMRTQKCFAVKQNINGLLDIARRTYSEIVDDIAGLAKTLAEEHDLPLKMGYNNTKGFYLTLYCGDKGDHTSASLPGIFIKVNKSRKTLNFTTMELINLNGRIEESLQEIYLMTNMVVIELMKDITEHFGCLHKLSDCVAVLDMLVSFAHACSLSDYVRPEFTDTLAVKQGRHPILDKISASCPVANNVYASNDSNFVIITGPNMSGKSTYLRQIALLQIQAQIGSFVPAQSASFRIAEQIFSRIGSDDDLETNSSTFQLEMKELTYIARNASRSSLIIIDELGRGTSTDEGLGICHSSCEYLLNLKAFTFFATHFKELTNLDALYPNVENYHFGVQTMLSLNVPKYVYTHTLAKGRSKDKCNGMQLADVSGLPKTFLKSAHEFFSKISEGEKRGETMTEESRQHRAVFKLGTRLAQAAMNSRLDESSLRIYLKHLKSQHEKEKNQSNAARSSAQVSESSPATPALPPQSGQRPVQGSHQLQQRHDVQQTPELTWKAPQFQVRHQTPQERLPNRQQTPILRQTTLEMRYETPQITQQAPQRRQQTPQLKQVPQTHAVRPALTPQRQQTPQRNVISQHTPQTIGKSPQNRTQGGQSECSTPAKSNSDSLTEGFTSESTPQQNIHRIHGNRVEQRCMQRENWKTPNQAAPRTHIHQRAKSPFLTSPVEPYEMSCFATSTPKKKRLENDEKQIPKNIAGLQTPITPMAVPPKEISPFLSPFVQRSDVSTEYPRSITDDDDITQAAKEKLTELDTSTHSPFQQVPHQTDSNVEQTDDIDI